MQCEEVWSKESTLLELRQQTRQKLQQIPQTHVLILLTVISLHHAHLDRRVKLLQVQVELALLFLRLGIEFMQIPSPFAHLWVNAERGRTFPSKRRLLVSSYGSGVCGSVGFLFSLRVRMDEALALRNEHQVTLISVRVLPEHDLLDSLPIRLRSQTNRLHVPLRRVARTRSISIHRKERGGL